MRTAQIKRFLTWLGFTLSLIMFSLAATFGLMQPSAVARAAAGDEITLTVEVSDIIKGQANPEFTVTMKVENNTGRIGCVEIVITPLDDNVIIGTADANYVAGDTWSAINGGAAIDGEKNIHIIGSDDAGITKNSFIHGGYKFGYSGTPSGAIGFNIALEAVSDDIGDPIDCKYNNQVLVADYDYTQENLTVTPREVETTNTLSALTLSVGGTQILSGTGDSQTVSEPIANADKANVKLSATRAGAASKIKVTEGAKTVVAEQAGDVSEISLGDLDVGEHTLTITVTAESGAVKTYTVKFTVAEPLAAPLAKPAAPSTTTGSYNGSPLDFTPNGLAALVSAGSVKLYSVSDTGAETEVGIDAFKPTDAGSYKIVARPTNGFSWADGGSDPEYAFTVNKAVIKATGAPEEGKLPSFTADGVSSLDGVVEYKYYSDATCTQEIAASSLTPGTTYYVKPVLKSGMEKNFEFDSGSVTQGIVNGGSSYEPSVGDKPNPDDGDKSFIEKNWIWLVVGVVLLLLLLLLILLLVKRNKKEKETVVQTPVSNAVVPQQEIAVADAKTEKLEERMREMEKTASEREVTRYKEEAERAERKADKMETPVAASSVASVTDAAAQERVKELEARMREMENATHERELAMEKEAHERELTRYKEEVARAERKAETPTATATPVASVSDTAAQERVKELEARMREMEKEAHEKELARQKEETERARKAEEEAKRAAEERYFVQSRVPLTSGAGDSERVRELEARIREMERDAREAERSAHGRELDRYKDEMEQVRREAERSRQDSYYGQPYSAANGAGDSERVKELEARIREMEKEAHDREIARYKEEAEAAKHAAEERFYAKYAMPEPNYVPYRANEEQSLPYVQKLEEQLRRMEQEAHERELARYRSEAERAKKEAEDLSRRSRQQEEELKRLRELQAMEQRSRELVTARNTTQGRSSESDMLQRMEEQMRRQNSELQSLTEELERKIAAMQNHKQ